MATGKTGLDYFPFDTDFFEDDKIQFVGARFGLKGENIAIRLLCKIYSEGYFYKFGEDESLLFAKRVGDGCQYSFVNDIVYELVKRGFFDKSIFDRFKLLTSAGIQKRYFEAVGRRKNVEIYGKLLLIDVSEMDNVNILPDNVYIIDQNGNISKQSKVNNSKVNKKESPNGDEKEGEPSSPTLSPDFIKFNDWLKRNAPFCSNPNNFPSQITEADLLKLKEKYSGKQIADVIEQIENRKDLRKRYVNLYRTVLNWAKNEYGK